MLSVMWNRTVNLGCVTVSVEFEGLLGSIKVIRKGEVESWECGVDVATGVGRLSMLVVDGEVVVSQDTVWLRR